MKRFGAQKAYLVCMVIMSVFVSILSGCGGGGGGVWTEPVAQSSATVSPAVPVDGATGVVTNSNLTATFSEAMNPATIVSPATNFTLVESVSGNPVAGVVTYSGTTATFNPNNDLKPNTKYTATISTGVRDLNGKALANNRVWSFTTGPAADTTLPKVTSTSPLTTSPGPTPNVSTGSVISATFDKVMDPATITAGTFTVTGPGTTPVPGAAAPVTYLPATKTATFHPLSASLSPGVTYTATIKGTGVNAAKDSLGNALAGNPLTPATASDYVWSFTTSLAPPLGPPKIDLLSISTNNFVILSASSTTGITDTNSHASKITGNIGLSPASAAAIGVFCSEMTGNIYGADVAYVGSGTGGTACFKGLPADNTTVGTAVLDMGTAYTAASAPATPAAVDAAHLNVGNGTLPAGTIFTPGTYTWGSNVNVTGDITLTGGASDVWIFQMSGNLNLSSAGSLPTGIHVILGGAAQASNVFWQVGGGSGATLGTYSTFSGNILSASQVVMQTGSVLHGRALAKTAVTLDASTVGP